MRKVHYPRQRSVSCMSLGVDYKVLSSLVMVNGAWVTLVVLRAARLSLMSNCGDPAGHSGGSGGGGGGGKV